jgi:hypothetical protein
MLVIQTSVYRRYAAILIRTAPIIFAASKKHDDLRGHCVLHSPSRLTCLWCGFKAPTLTGGLPEQPMRFTQSAPSGPAGCV